MMGDGREKIIVKAEWWNVRSGDFGNSGILLPDSLLSHVKDFLYRRKTVFVFLRNEF